MGKPDKQLGRIFPYLGSKRQLLPIILPLIPPHKVFHEGFCGGASVLLSKPEVPGVVNVCNDLDKSLIGFYRKFSIPEVEKCKKIRNVCEFAKKSRKRVRAGSSNVCEQIAARRFSIVSDIRGGLKSRECQIRPIITKQLDKLAPEFARKLKATQLTAMDFATSARKVDGKNTFHFFDPVYPGTTTPSKFKASEATPEQVCNLARSLKGQVLITYNEHPDVLKACTGRGLHIRRVPSKHRSKRVTKGNPKTHELLISNYRLPKNGSQNSRRNGHRS